MSDEKVDIDIKLRPADRIAELINSTHVTYSDTVDLMLAETFSEKLVAEYFQLKIRYDELNKMILKIEAGTANFEINTKLNTLKEQLYHMNEYMKLLRLRAELEHIDLDPLTQDPNAISDLPKIVEPSEENKEQEKGEVNNEPTI